MGLEGQFPLVAMRFLALLLELMLSGSQFVSVFVVFFKIEDFKNRSSAPRIF